MTSAGNYWIHTGRQGYENLQNVLSDTVASEDIRITATTNATGEFILYQPYGPTATGFSVTTGAVDILNNETVWDVYGNTGNLVWTNGPGSAVKFQPKPEKVEYRDKPVESTYLFPELLCKRGQQARELVGRP